MSILSQYLEFTDKTEPPKQYHRWSFLTCASAALGRNVWITHGASKIYANMYTMLVGVPGTRKSSAIKMASKRLKEGGYYKFAYNKTTKQKFLSDFDEINLPKKEGSSEVDILEALEKDFTASSECFIAADEFADFIGVNNLEFITLLTALWDNLDEYTDRFKNSKSVCIREPTITILGGVTPVSFNTAIPQESSGSGFLSRLILVYGEPSSTRITWPKIPEPGELEMFSACFEKLQNLQGELAITPQAKHAIDEIYTNWENLEDVRLQYYGSRRLTHLFKVCIVIAALKSIEQDAERPEIDEEVVLEANTILTYTEDYMSSALGELGKSRYSDAAQKLIEKLSNENKPVKISELYQSVSQDVERRSQFMELLHNLSYAKKITINTHTLEDNEATVLLTRRRSGKDRPYVDYRKYIQEYEERHETLKILPSN